MVDPTEPASAIDSDAIDQAARDLAFACRVASADEVAACTLASFIRNHTASVREPLERRVRELEEQVELRKVSATTMVASISELEAGLRGYVEAHQNDRDRIASLEAQLATAREEALREAIALLELHAPKPDPAYDHEHLLHQADGFDSALKLVTQLLTSPPKSPWVPVEERLPEGDTWVDLCWKGKRYEGHRYIYGEKWDGLWWIQGHGRTFEAPSHWMPRVPLPEPPPADQKEPHAR